MQRERQEAETDQVAAARGTIAWAINGVILLSSTFFYRILRERGLIAVERLMGMLLVMVAVQMFMNGVKAFRAA